jgi:hypothetical protein
MQKISSYLYSNRIQAVVNLAASPLEWRIVYQRKFKIYQGLDNVLELDVKNAEQKRIDITTYAMKFVVMDQLNQEIYTGDVDTDTGIKGIGLMTIPSTALEFVSPQFLKYTVYILNDDDTKTPVYGDTQFGVTGTIDYLAGAMPTTLLPKVIKTFVYDIDVNDPTWETRIYRSDAVEINPPNDIVENPTLTVNFFASALAAEVNVQITSSLVISTETPWTTIETFNITSNTSTLEKVYGAVDGYNKEAGWLRITYTPVSENTGKFDKVLVSV